MMRIRTFPALLALIMVWAAPVAGQGKGKEQGAGKGGGKGKQQAQQVSSQGREGKGAAKSERGRGNENRPSVSAKGERGNAGSELRGKGAGGAEGPKLTGADKRDANRVEHVSAGDVHRGFKIGKPGRFTRELEVDHIALPARTFVVSDRPGERLLGKAVALAFARGVGDNTLLIVPVGERLFVRNGVGDVLVDLDQDRARDLGHWTVVSLDDDVKRGAPSFCRSGAGHPVWGRQWCIDKGFGLGGDSDWRWARAVDPRDIVFRRTDTGDLTHDVLAGVLGDVVLNRLGLHAVTLGYTDPMTGRWLGDASGPRVLLVTSGGRPVAEIVDRDRDGRAENLFVALRAW